MDLIPPGTRILCLAPHPDDLEFGLGGTLHRYRGRYHGLGLVFSDRAGSRGETRNREEQRRAADLTGLGGGNVRFVDDLPGGRLLPPRFFAAAEQRDLIRQVVAGAVRDFDPDLIFVPGLEETMQDHQAVAEETVRIARGRAGILGYEVPRHNRHFRPTAFVALGEEDVAAKVAAIAAYTEFTSRYYFSAEAIRALAVVRALDAGQAGLVEAFEVYRLYVGGAGSPCNGL